jgi:hypothetical protein
MEKEIEMKLTPLLSKVIVKEVSQKLQKELLGKFTSQTKDSPETIIALINKFDNYKEGLPVDKRDITRYNYNDLKSLITGKEVEKTVESAFTQLKKKYDKLKNSLPEEQSGPYRYENTALKSLIKKFYDK